LCDRCVNHGLKGVQRVRVRKALCCAILNRGRPVLRLWIRFRHHDSRTLLQEFFPFRSWAFARGPGNVPRHFDRKVPGGKDVELRPINVARAGQASNRAIIGAELFPGTRKCCATLMPATVMSQSSLGIRGSTSCSMTHSGLASKTQRRGKLRYPC
jgi:hypothetical protein